MKSFNSFGAIDVKKSSELPEALNVVPAIQSIDVTKALNLNLPPQNVQNADMALPLDPVNFVDPMQVPIQPDPFAIPGVPDVGPSSSGGGGFYAPSFSTNYQDPNQITSVYIQPSRDYAPQTIDPRVVITFSDPLKNAIATIIQNTPAVVDVLKLDPTPADMKDMKPTSELLDVSAYYDIRLPKLEASLLSIIKSGVLPDRYKLRDLCAQIGRALITIKEGQAVQLNITKELKRSFTWGYPDLKKNPLYTELQALKLANPKDPNKTLVSAIVSTSRPLNIFELNTLEFEWFLSKQLDGLTYSALTLEVWVRYLNNFYAVIHLFNTFMKSMTKLLADAQTTGMIQDSLTAFASAEAQMLDELKKLRELIKNTLEASITTLTTCCDEYVKNQAIKPKSEDILKLCDKVLSNFSTQTNQNQIFRNVSQGSTFALDGETYYSIDGLIKILGDTKMTKLGQDPLADFSLTVQPKNSPFSFSMSGSDSYSLDQHPHPVYNTMESGEGSLLAGISLEDLPGLGAPPPVNPTTTRTVGKQQIATYTECDMQGREVFVTEIRDLSTGRQSVERRPTGRSCIKTPEGQWVTEQQYRVMQETNEKYARDRRHQGRTTSTSSSTARQEELDKQRAHERMLAEQRAREEEERRRAEQDSMSGVIGSFPSDHSFVMQFDEAAGLPKEFGREVYYCGTDGNEYVMLEITEPSIEMKGFGVPKPTGRRCMPGPGGAWIHPDNIRASGAPSQIGVGIQMSPAVSGFLVPTDFDLDPELRKQAEDQAQAQAQAQAQRQAEMQRQVQAKQTQQAQSSEAQRQAEAQRQLEALAKKRGMTTNSSSSGTNAQGQGTPVTSFHRGPKQNPFMGLFPVGDVDFGDLYDDEDDE